MLAPGHILNFIGVGSCCWVVFVQPVYALPPVRRAECRNGRVLRKRRRDGALLIGIASRSLMLVIGPGRRCCYSSLRAGPSKAQLRLLFLALLLAVMAFVASKVDVSSPTSREVSAAWARCVLTAQRGFA